MTTKTARNGVKSKERVRQHGEVFTPDWIVDDMLNLHGIKEECARLESKFLEPSCGEGAFLVKILERKLKVVNKLHNTSLDDWETHAILALTTLYGIELLEDNAEICTMNLSEVFSEHYKKACKKHKTDINLSTKRAAQFIIARNIIEGNALTYRKCLPKCGNKCNKCEPIIFSEWTPKADGFFERKDYTYEGLIDAAKLSGTNEGDLLDNINTEPTRHNARPYKTVHFRELIKEESG
ncbi:MAG: N-6 DNA methylase [Bifidobacteriaceae bacterium]|jgi:hypothetical protein|nr:N-6 DNA methylase [Bifidobacteriaceae bacterium]